MVGISTSEQTLAAAFPGRSAAIHCSPSAPGVDPADSAAGWRPRSSRAGSRPSRSSRSSKKTSAAIRTFNKLIQGFLGLGLLVGVAALGVISARAVVERRQQIGVMRAIGFRERTVQLAFLLESSFVALTAIVVGTALGLLLAWNIIRDQQAQPSGRDSARRALAEPALVFAVVYAVAIAATLAPAIRASRIRPAEALRYQ